HEALIVPAFERVAARLPGTLPEARQLLPEALARAARGDGVSADRAVPLYLRGASAWRKLGDPPPAGAPAAKR
ncbi:MAG TPA: hypothetical protein VLA56_06795, partial [Pseudomonadales bacterium]|nr:hypothetical protein [Pseudomonadales bacterium]